MTLGSVKPGQIWQIKGSTHLALVVCVFEDEMFGQDLRVIPIFAGRAYLGVATADDIVIPPTHSSIFEPLLGICSNAQSIAQADLLLYRGEVSAEALEAARSLELLGIAPELEKGLAGWRGVPVGMIDEPEAAISSGRLRLFQVWDDIRSSLIQFRNSYTVEMPVEVYGVGSLFRGRGLNTLRGYLWQPVAAQSVFEGAVTYIAIGQSGTAATRLAVESTRFVAEESTNEACLSIAGRAA
jgi:hypothetical protein